MQGYFGIWSILLQDVKKYIYILRQRVTIHNQQIRDPKTRMLKVSEHIANCAHNLNPKYKIFPFYKMYSESTTLRRAKEKFFINTLKPKLNRLH